MFVSTNQVKGHLQITKIICKQLFVRDFYIPGSFLFHHQVEQNSQFEVVVHRFNRALSTWIFPSKVRHLIVSIWRREMHCVCDVAVAGAPGTIVPQQVQM